MLDTRERLESLSNVLGQRATNVRLTRAGHGPTPLPTTPELITQGVSDIIGSGRVRGASASLEPQADETMPHITKMPSWDGSGKLGQQPLRLDQQKDVNRPFQQTHDMTTVRLSPFTLSFMDHPNLEMRYKAYHSRQALPVVVVRLMVLALAVAVAGVADALRCCGETLPYRLALRYGAGFVPLVIAIFLCFRMNSRRSLRTRLNLIVTLALWMAVSSNIWIEALQSWDVDREGILFLDMLVVIVAVPLAALFFRVRYGYLLVFAWTLTVEFTMAQFLVKSGHK